MWWFIIGIYIIIGLFVSGISINTFEEGKTPGDKLVNVTKGDGGIVLIGILIFFWPIMVFAIIFFLIVYFTKDLGNKLRNFLDKNDL